MMQTPTSLIERARSPSAPSAKAPRRGRFTRRRALWLLAAILVLAAAIRAATLAFGLPSLNDQDELMFEMGAVRMLRGHTLDPGWFGHPATTTIYLLALINGTAFAIGRAAGWFADPAQFMTAIYHDPGWLILAGRVAMAGFGLLTIALTFRLARRLRGTRVALVAALLMTLDPLHVAYSQIIRSDVMACAFGLLAMLAALRLADRGLRRDAITAGLWAGVAVATKWPFALVLAAPLGAMLHRWRSHGEPPARAFVTLAWCGLASVVALVVTSPFLVLDWPTVVRNLHGETQVRHLGATGGSFAWNAWWYLREPLRHALGPAGLLLAGAGCLILAADRRARAILGPPTIAFAVLICAQQLVWARWALPLLAPLAIAAGAAAVALGKAARHRFGCAGEVTALAVLAAAVLPPLVLANIADGRERMNDTRQQATAWVRGHVPPGRTLLLEHFAFDLIDNPYPIVWPLGQAGCVDGRALLAGGVSYQTIDVLRAGRTNIDYGTVAPARIASCRADYAILSQYDRYAAERDDFPAEYGTYRSLLAQGRTLAVFRPRAGAVGGWVVRVVALAPPPRRGGPASRIPGR